MKIHIISTENGILNEGMRNVATHITHELSGEYQIEKSELKAIPRALVGAARSDAVLVFARGNKLVYYLVKMTSALNKNVWMVCVQKPDNSFIRLCQRNPLKCNYMTLVPDDLEVLNIRKKYSVKQFHVGISDKFSPVGRERQNELKHKFGFSTEKCLLVHVGHCSTGRGLEDMLAIHDPCIEKMVVCSGMFENGDIAEALNENGVKVIRDYLPNVEEIYQMADVYLFPTKSAEYVISIPLSVMEALACGTPVVGYDSFQNLKHIGINDAKGITLIEEKNQLEMAVKSAKRYKQKCSYLDALSWGQCAHEVADIVQGGMIK